MAASRKFYLRSVARRWKKAVEESTGSVLIFSPFITQGAVDYVFGGVQPAGCKVYTRFRAEDFLSGASSIKALQQLLGLGVSLYQLSGLHAKMLIVPEKFASIGSQNLTAQGRRNREATAVFTSPQAVERIQQLAEQWIQEADEITQEQVATMAAAIEPLIAKFAEIKGEAERVDREARRRLQVLVPAESEDVPADLDDLDSDEDDEGTADLYDLDAEDDGRGIPEEEPPAPPYVEVDQDEHPDDPLEDLPPNTAPADVLLEMLEDEDTDEAAWDDEESDDEESNEEDDKDGSDWLTDEDEQEEEDEVPAVSPSGSLWPMLFPAGVPEHRESFRRAISRARTARQVVQAEVKLLGESGRRKASLVAPANANLTSWVVEGREVTLKSKHRYMCILQGDYTWGWARVAKTRISFIAPALTLTEPVVLGDFLTHRFHFDSGWEGSSDIQGNLRITAYSPWDNRRLLPLVTIDCWFGFDVLQIFKANVMAGLSDARHVEGERLREWLLDNRDAFQTAMLPKIISPFKYTANLFGKRADRFFGPLGSSLSLRLVIVKGHEVLVARRL